MNGQKLPVPPLALKSLYFPSQVTLNPAEHYDAGIPIRAVEGGLQGIIPAWLIMSIGDLVEVFWGNDSAAIWSKELLNADELDKDVAFTIAKGQVHEGDATPVFYRVTRKNQTPEDSTPFQTLLVKLSRPGEYDDDPGEDGHSDLKFTLSHKEVDENLPPEGVTMHIVPYRNLTRYDRILARWGSQQRVHVVTPEQAQDPIKKPIEVVFSRALIDAAGDGDRVAVAYQPIDRCGNYPDERAPWSATHHVLVDLGGNRLDAPQVLVNGQPTDRVDLDTLGDDDVIVRVYTPTKDFAVYDEVLLTWTGPPAQGSQIIVGPLSMRVEFVPFHLDFTIPNAAVKAIAKGAASVGYVRRRSDESDRRSKNTSVTVIGDISQLVAPTVVEATGGTLPSETKWATVQIPWYPGRNSSHLINLIWSAQKPGGDKVYYEDPRTVGDVADNQPVLRSVSNAEIQRFNGLNVTVYYVVTDSETGLLSVRESLPFRMQVGVALPTFKRPEVEGTGANDVLDPENVPPTGAVLVAPHLDTRDKDRVNYRWRGSASGGSTNGHVDLIPATAGRPVRITVDKKYLTANLNGTVVADYNIQRAGETLGHSHELTLRIGTALEDLLPPFLVAPAEDPIDVLAYPEGITVRIEFLEALSGDRARLVEVNPPAGSPQFPLVEFNSNKRVNTVLSPAFLAARHGQTIQLRWNLNRNNAQFGKSPILPLNVLKIADEDTRLPSPKIPQAPDDKVLNLNSFDGNAQVTVLPWTGISTENIVQLKISGKDNNNSDQTLPILTNHKITATEVSSGIKETLTREQLLTLKHDTEFNVSLEVLPGTTNNLAPIAFPTLTLNLLKNTLVILEGFETGIVGEKPVGTVMDFPSMTVTVLAARVAIGANGSFYAPPITEKYLHITPFATLRFTLKQPAKSIRFGIADASRAPSPYKCYDENLQLIKAGSTPSYGGQDQVWVDITETPNRKIKFIDITDGGGDSYLDNFSIFY